jgi:hypothetical protein
LVTSGNSNKNVHEKVRKGDRNPREERKTRPALSREQQIAGKASERRINISADSMKPPQTKSKRNNSVSHPVRKQEVIGQSSQELAWGTKNQHDL